MRANEEGLTLVEMVVALMVVGFAMMAMASVAITSLHAIQGSERTTKATAVGNEYLERLVALDYDLVGMYEDEVGETTFDGEDVVLLPASSNPDERVPKPSTTTVRDGIEYTIETVVTWVDDPVDKEEANDEDGATDYKRIVVDVSWEARGSSLTRRVQTLRAPEPLDQLLNVTIEPEQVRLKDSNGKNDQHVTVTVHARIPQSGVKVEYLNRDEELAEASLTSEDTDKTLWSVSFEPNATRIFANGETLFTITGTAEDGDRVSTTIGRTLFLHDLDVLVIDDNDFADDEDGTDEFTESYELSVDVDGNMCDDALEVYSHVRGGLTSDPVTAILHPDGTAHDAEDAPIQTTVLEAMDDWNPPDGARFQRTMTLDQALSEGSYDLTVLAERAADAVEDWRTADVTVTEVDAC